MSFKFTWKGKAMSEERITEYSLNKECEELAQEIYADIMGGKGADENPEDYRDEMMDRAHEDADGHQWAIYIHHARQMCADCDVSRGEEFLEDVGMPEEVTFDKLATTIAYGEMRARIEEALGDLIDAREEPESDEEEGE